MMLLEQKRGKEPSRMCKCEGCAGTNSTHSTPLVMGEREEKRRLDGQPEVRELSRASGSVPDFLVLAQNSQPAKCVQASRAEVREPPAVLLSLGSLKLSKHAFSTFLAEKQLRLIGLSLATMESNHFLTCLLAYTRLTFSSNETAWTPPGSAGLFTMCFRRLFLRNALLVYCDKRTNTTEHIFFTHISCSTIYAFYGRGQ